MSLLLAIDVGNTHITVGAFQEKALLHTWRLQTNPHDTTDELGLQLLNLVRHAGARPADLTGVVIASVVPSLDASLHDASVTYLHHEPLEVTASTNIGIVNRYKKPEEVGADRLVNAVAVHSFFKESAIVVDFGTATTFDCVSAKGEYLGGAICPGLEIAAEGLATHTAKLPRVTFEEAPAHALGKTTKESLQSGLFWGYIGLVEGLLQRLTKEMGGKPKLVATGGLSSLIGPHLKHNIRIMPELTLEGLRLIWERNN